MAPLVTDELISAAKRALRKAVVAQRDALSCAERAQFSERITRKLLALPSYRNANRVLAYCSIGSEFHTHEFLLATLRLGKRLLLPRVDRIQLELQLFYVESLERQLIPGVWGILEPDPRECEAAVTENVEWVLVPGVAFDSHGRRLGYGGGYYDKLLSSLSPNISRVAAAFSLQIVDQVPSSAHDQRVHVVVTEDAEMTRPGLTGN